MTRQKKSPSQRAQEALDVEERRVNKLTTQWKTAQTEYERLSKERDDAMVRRDYLLKHPDLPKQSDKSTTTTPGTTNQSGDTK